MFVALARGNPLLPALGNRPRPEVLPRECQPREDSCVSVHCSHYWHSLPVEHEAEGRVVQAQTCRHGVLVLCFQALRIAMKVPVALKTGNASPSRLILVD